MNNWLPYPKYKPENTAAAQKADYVVLIPNPYYINKHGFNENTPRYRVEQALWLGDKWQAIDYVYYANYGNSFDVKYFIQLPSHS